ncbi:hypothetical protein GBA52_022546 [Prunus armeniaca]|nr:hypothetical protein GBA52_022546 [Prunus armeniaca]
MVKRKNSGENIVRGGRHGLRRGLDHHPHKFLNISNEETVRGSSDPLLPKMFLNFSGPPPKQHCHP